MRRERTVRIEKGRREDRERIEYREYRYDKEVRENREYSEDKEVRGEKV